MKTTVFHGLSALALLACVPAQAATPSLACDGVSGAKVTVETAERWETSRLAERVPKGPKLEGVRLAVRPEAGLSAELLERTLRCGAGPVGEALAREGVRDVEVRGAGASYEVRVRSSSEAVVERLLASLRAK